MIMGNIIRILMSITMMNDLILTLYSFKLNSIRLICGENQINLHRFVPLQVVHKVLQWFSRSVFRGQFFIRKHLMCCVAVNYNYSPS